MLLLDGRYNPQITSGVEVMMRSAMFLRLSLGIVLVVLPARTQNVNPGRPEEVHVQKQPSPDDLRARMNSVQLQKDVKELAELCSAVPADMYGVKQGLLPKEVLERLKRVEKLSKRVREELTR